MRGRILVPLVLLSWLLGPVRPARAASISVTTLADEYGSNPAACSLREAIKAANDDTPFGGCTGGSDDDRIDLQAGIYSLTRSGVAPTSIDSGDLDVTADLTIAGAGPGATVLDGAWSTAATDRIIEISGAGTDASISGVTVQDGLTVSSGIESGAGILVGTGTSLTLTDALISQNRAVDDGDGGGIRAIGSATIEDVAIVGNVANEDGGGIDISGIVTLTNVTVSGNRSGLDGGGVATDDSATLNNVTITGNSAGAGSVFPRGGGIRFFGAASVRNTLIAGNDDQSTDPRDDCSGTLASQGHNLVRITTGCSGLDPAAGDLSGVDPLLGPLGDNGGPTQTHALLTGSPAIDAGAPPGSGLGACAATDQRGVPRTGTCDIGAYELTRCQKAVVNLVGTDGSDRLAGTGAPDGILGLGGKDRLAGKGGKDGLCGGPGRDTLKAGGGKDHLDGGPGKDTCVGQGGRDRARACEREKSL